MGNCSEQVRVWVDGEYRFGRDIGPLGAPGAMWPASQLPPLHQFADLELGAGIHTLELAIRRPPVERVAEWVVGIIDPDSVNGSRTRSSVSRIRFGPPNHPGKSLDALADVTDG